MSERKSFTFRKEWRDAMTGLSKRERQTVYEAIIDYGITGECADLSPSEEIAFSFVKAAIDNDAERSREVSLRRAEAGRKGGAPKGNDNAKKRDTESTAQIVKAAKQPVVTTGANAEFEKWLKEKCPYVYEHIPMMTDEEFNKLKKEYGSKAISEVCLDLENRKDLRKRYASMYRTLLNWLKNYVKSNSNGTAVRTNNQTAQDRANDAAGSVARLLAEDDAG